MRRLGAVLACGLVVTSGALALANPIPPKPQNPIKWSQKPDLATSYDIPANNHLPGPGIPGPVPIPTIGDLVADDFRSDGRPVTDVHWWGSYANNNIANKPQAFWIGFWTDRVGADPSQPDTLVTSYLFPFPETHEMFFGLQDRFPIRDPGGAEIKINAYQYFVDLPVPFFEEQGIVYWLSIQALSSADWGWKTGFPNFRDDAIKASGTAIGIVPPPPLPVGSLWPCPPNGPALCIKLVDDDDRTKSLDMAFELTTIPAPGALLLLATGLIGLAAARRRRG